MIEQSAIWLCLPAGERPPPVEADGAPQPLPPEVLAQPVLVIEDEVMIAWWLESLLEDLGFATVRIAATAADALALAEVLSPGLVVSDINLGPGAEDGISAVAMIAARGPVATLFVTARADPGALGRIAAVAPLARVLRKPVAAPALRAAVMELFVVKRPH